MHKTRFAFASLVAANTLTLGAATVVAPFALASGAVAAQQPGPSQQLFNNPYYSCNRNYYVAVTGSDANSGTSLGAAWATLQHADSGRAAGDCVNVAPGTYNRGVVINSGGNAATRTGYVVWRCTTLDACTVTDQNSAFAWNGSVQPMTGNFVIVDGFKMQAAAGGNANSQGVNISTPGDRLFSVHHVWIINNMVTNWGQSGLQMNDGDYLYAVHNTTYNNSHTGCYQGSGISFYEPKAVSGYQRMPDDSATPMLHAPLGNMNIAIAWNVSYNNAVLTCGTASAPYNTDGDGIIADTFNNANAGGVVYPSTALIAFNDTYNNGGRGISISFSENIIIANNSCYNNDLDPFDSGTWRPCIGAVDTYGLQFFNNVAKSMTGPGFLSYNTPYGDLPAAGKTPVDTWTNNLADCIGNPGYGCELMQAPVAPFSCTLNQCNVDPAWVGVGTTSPGSETSQPLAAQFALTPNSPAIGKGKTASYLPPISVDQGSCWHAHKVCPPTRNQP